MISYITLYFELVLPHVSFHTIIDSWQDSQDIIKGDIIRHPQPSHPPLLTSNEYWRITSIMKEYKSQQKVILELG